MDTEIERLRVRESGPETFLKAGFRLLHAQCQWANIPGFYNLPWVDSSYVACGTLWKPGWGLHSCEQLVEVRLCPGANIVVWSHDVYSRHSPPGRLRSYSFGNRYIHEDSSYTASKHVHCVTDPKRLGIARLGLSRRAQTQGVYSDPVNEVWFRIQDVVAVREIATNVLDTRRFEMLKIKIAGDWVPVSISKS